MCLKWFESNPFDIGFTTTNALEAIQKNPSSYYAAKAASKVQNSNSRSNGSLMKISPMIVWTSKMARHEVFEAIKYEVEFLHPDPIVHKSIYIYTIAVQHLLHNHG